MIIRQAEAQRLNIWLQGSWVQLRVHTQQVVELKARSWVFAADPLRNLGKLLAGQTRATCPPSEVLNLFEALLSLI